MNYAGGDKLGGILSPSSDILHDSNGTSVLKWQEYRNEDRLTVARAEGGDEGRGGAARAVCGGGHALYPLVSVSVSSL